MCVQYIVLCFSILCCVSAASVEVCDKQGCVYAIPQGPPDPQVNPRHIGGQREGGEHGGVAQGENMFVIIDDS